MMEYVMQAADMILFAVFFYLFMSRTGNKRFHSIWLYIASYALFAAGYVWAGTTGSILTISGAVLALMLALELLMFRNPFSGYAYSVIYAAGFLMCRTFCQSLILWIYSSITVIHLLSFGGMDAEVQTAITYFVTWFAESAWTFCILAVLKRTGIEEEKLPLRQCLLLMLFPVFSMVYLFSIIVMSADIFVIRYGYGPVLANVLLIFAMNLLFLYFFRSMQKGHRAWREQKLYRQEAELLYKHYQKLEESYQSSRKVIHDARNHMQAVARLYETGETQKAKEYAQDVFHLLNQTGHTWYTDNRMLNIILNEKLNQENMNRAKIELDIEEGSIDRLKEIHITTIFANLLDNAIEAIGVQGEAYLSLQIKNVNDFLIISLVNSLGKKAEPGEGHEKLGLKNVKSALDVYHGTLKTAREDDRFKTVIMIPKEGDRADEEAEK